jgi:hypothetical protein
MYLYLILAIASLVIGFLINMLKKKSKYKFNALIFLMISISGMFLAKYIHDTMNPKHSLTETENLIKESFIEKLKEEITSTQTTTIGKKNVVLICNDLVECNKKITALKESLKDHKDIEIYSLKLDNRHDVHADKNRKICELINSISTKKEFFTLIFFDGIEWSQDFDGVDDNVDLSLIKIISLSRPETGKLFKKFSSINYLYFNSENKNKKIDHKISINSASQIFWISKEIKSIH